VLSVLFVIVIFPLPLLGRLSNLKSIIAHLAIHVK
jgi:hypothetical protein